MKLFEMSDSSRRITANLKAGHEATIDEPKLLVFKIDFNRYAHITNGDPKMFSRYIVPFDS